MPVIPRSISTTEYATLGEKKLHKIFVDLYSDSEDVYVWYEPPALTPAGSRDSSRKVFTDFIIFSQSYGILNLEVKDWRMDKIKKVDKNHWDIEVRPGVIEKKDSPLEQSRRCAYAIKDKLVSEPQLTHQAGGYKGKPLFPFGYGVVLANIERHELEKGDDIEGIAPKNQFLYKDDLDFDVASRDDRLSFEKRLREMFTHPYNFDSLSYSKLKVLRKTIWPELEIPPRPAVSGTLFDLRVLDMQQEEFARSLGGGHHLIKGVVGSGKTIVLAYRARYLHNLRRDWKILFVCYNKSLKNYLEAILNNLLDDDQKNNIEVFYFHELVFRKTGESTAMKNGETDEEWDRRLGLILNYAAVNKKIKGGQYDAILIDEAQDFSTEWLRGVRSLLGNNDILTIAYDPAQEVWPRKRVWKDAGIDVVGGRRSRPLKQSYRNTNEILRLAVNFQGYQEYLTEDLDDIETPAIPEEVERHGEKVTIQGFKSYTDVFAEVKNRIAAIVKSGKYSYKDIGIITCSVPSDDVQAFTKQKEIPVRSLLQSSTRKQFSMYEDTVKLITVESSKGLEWKVVFFLGIDSLPRKGRNVKHERNIIYIGITRAQELLHIYFAKETPYIVELKEINEKI